MIDWRWYAFDELGVDQLYAIVAAREAVFVVEQDCAYQELDGLDPAATHLVGWAETQVAAYLRILAPGVRFSEPSMGRILTTAPFRATGIGRQLVQLGLDHVDEQFKGASVRISAQAHLQKFYGSFGFATVSQPYLEDGIPHVEMLRIAR